MKEQKDITNAKAVQQKLSEIYMRDCLKHIGSNGRGYADDNISGL